MYKILAVYLVAYTFARYRMAIGSPYLQLDGEATERTFGDIFEHRRSWIPKRGTFERLYKGGAEDVFAFLNKKIEQLEAKHKTFIESLHDYFKPVSTHFSKHYDELFGDDKKPGNDQGVPVMHGGNNASINGKPENATSQAASQQHESMTNQKPAENNGVKGTPAEQGDEKDTPAPVEDGEKEGAIAPPSISDEETTIKPKEQSIEESDRTGESEASHGDENAQATSTTEQNPQSEEKKPSGESAETAEVV